MLLNLINALIISLGFNILMFVPVYYYKTDKLTDLSYATSFVAISLYGFLFGGLTFPSLILFIMILLWAIRLGGYLFIRINKVKKDSRFDEMRNKFWSFIRFWVLQGFTVWVVLIPSNLFFLNRVESTNNLGIIGILFWLTGLLIETFSDLQKYRFINKSKNKGKWINSGLWKYSRHPNYFGEITLWLGVYIYTLFGLNSGQALLGLVSPIYISVLIIFVSGVPLLEKAADKKWGKDEDYQEYKKNTNVLVPYINLSQFMVQFLRKNL